MKSPKNVAVIGAGMAGLAAARALCESGVSVAVWEKSARVGGRVSSREVGGVVFDSGAQNVKSGGSRLERVLAALPCEARVFIEEPICLRDGARVLAGDEAHNAAPKWSFRGGINNLAQALARDAKSRGARFYYGNAIAALRENATDFSLLNAQNGELFRADFVILTAPLPQSAAILQSSEMRDRSSTSARISLLKRCEYSRCLSVLLRYEEELRAEWYALLSRDRAAPLLWLAREDSKKFAANGSALVAQLGNDASHALWSEDDAKVAALAARFTGEIVGQQWRTPRNFLVKRWRYSQPVSPIDFVAANPAGARVLIAGDGVSAGRVTDAYESGWRAASCVLKAMQS